MTYDEWDALPKDQHIEIATCEACQFNGGGVIELCEHHESRR
jgi:hypothetical protein